MRIATYGLYCIYLIEEDIPPEIAAFSIRGQVNRTSAVGGGGGTPQQTRVLISCVSVTVTRGWEGVKMLEF